nr:transposase domain-containing protein [Streptacidiphilus albus]
MAGGRFVLGHPGELIRGPPFELVDAVLEETLTVRRRLRDPPSRVGVHFVFDARPHRLRRGAAPAAVGP